MYDEILVPCTHAQKEITCSNASLHPSEQFYMHKNISGSVLIVWELIELTESCHLLKKRSKSAQMYHEILVPCTHAQKEITCSNANLHPSEQFYMHKNTSGSVLIVWELIELTESCHLLKKALKVLWKCADVPRNSRTLDTCAEGHHLFKWKFTSQWTVLYA